LEVEIGFAIIGIILVKKGILERPISEKKKCRRR